MHSSRVFVFIKLLEDLDHATNSQLLKYSSKGREYG